MQLLILPCQTWEWQPNIPTNIDRSRFGAGLWGSLMYKISLELLHLLKHLQQSYRVSIFFIDIALYRLYHLYLIFIESFDRHGYAYWQGLPVFCSVLRSTRSSNHWAYWSNARKTRAWRRKQPYWRLVQYRGLGEYSWARLLRNAVPRKRQDLVSLLSKLLAMILIRKK
jgi:hypothetical protein